MNDVIKHKIKHNAHRALVSVKWVIFAILVGGIVGLCGTAFYFCLTFVTVLRGQNPWLLYLQALRGTDQKVRLLFALRLMVITKDQIIDVRKVGLLRNRESSHDVMPPC